MNKRPIVHTMLALGFSIVVLIAGCGGSGAGGSGTGGDIVDPGADLVNTLWVGEDQQDPGNPELVADVVMTFRENGKGVWVTYEDWTSPERSVTNGACFTVSFLSDTEMEVSVFAEFKEGFWVEPGSQPGVMPYSVANGVMTVGDAAAPEFVVTMVDDGLSDPLRGTSWKHFDIEANGNAQALEFRGDGSMEYLAFEYGAISAERGIYFVYGLDNQSDGDNTLIRAVREVRPSLSSNWVDISVEPYIASSEFAIQEGDLQLSQDEIVLVPAEGNGSLQGNAWLGHEVLINNGPQIEAVGLAAAAPDLDDVLILAHANGSYGFSVFDQWPQDGDLPPQRSEGNCGTGDFASGISTDFEIYAEWYSELDGQENPLPPDWHSSEGSGQAPFAHLGDLFIEQIDEDGGGFALQYVDIGELNPLSGTQWVGTHFDNSAGATALPTTMDADLVFASDGTFEGVFTDEGVIAMGIRGRYFVVAPGEMAWWIDEEYDIETEAWDVLVEPNAWGIEYQIVGNELEAADYSGDNVVEATLVP